MVDGGWVARVQVTWRYRGFDASVGRAEVAVTFGEGGATVDGVAPYGSTMPLWLTGPIAVRRDADSLVVTTGRRQPLDRYGRQAAEAVDTVREVLDRPVRLVVEVPASVDQLNGAVGAEPGTYDAIAAVTAGLDGTFAPETPVHVFLNPAVFGGLEAVAAQIVMTHEAVHVVTEAPLAQSAELWLLEGFADYVALRDTDLPLSRTAAQIVERVRRQGVPETLPLRTEFDTRASHLGAVYESAWLICVVLAERGGEGALVDFYDAVVQGALLEDELERIFGWSVADLTRAWQARLADVAGVPTGG
ncbi:hypothetical protein HNR19_002642 [Nocardioides thalensis]|uniref:Peptidase MA-like domain-containing protein n=1 Tax=Nocardioides thalensis TaxID=1914755 RepID=A0A853C3I4_9ACTN|nr:hypothetical protein [Nocardioides thalensis]NYJ01944.1 hypothetical protein [Nocardioides thalensis]